MKSKFDFSRVQWLNRELIPVESRYTWFKKESRFVKTFKWLQPSEGYFALMHKNSISNNIDVIKILTQEDTRTSLMIKKHSK